MSVGKRSVAVHAVGVFAILATVALAPRAASADGNAGDDIHAAQSGVTLGGRAMY